MSGSCSYLIVDVHGMSNDDGSSDLKHRKEGNLSYFYGKIYSSKDTKTKGSYPLFM